MSSTPVETQHFVTGSTMRHVIVMAGTSAVGLIAIFAVDAINMYYISLLGQKALAAAVGFAGVVGFFQTSFCIGMTIGISAVISRTVGSGDIETARRRSTAGLVLIALTTATLGSSSALFLPEIVGLIGASGETALLATRYLAITVHTLPLLGVGMACAALLRSVGDARRAMNVTLGAALAIAVLDPLLIFGLDLELQGAALAVVVSRLILAIVGLHGVLVSHRLAGRFNKSEFAADTAVMLRISGPAVLSNLATPFGAAFVTHFMADFGASAIAGQATVDRLTPVTFGLVYAVSGAVGPILAQNLGASRPDRVKKTLQDSLLFVAASVIVAWLVLFLTQELIISVFSADGLAASLIRLFCTWVAPSFIFIGGLFVANAAFNNLGYPLLSPTFNWARATLGTIPFAYAGSYYGASGVMVGQALGSAIVSGIAIFVALRITKKLATVNAVRIMPIHTASK